MAARKGEKRFYFQPLSWTEPGPAHPAGHGRSLMAWNAGRAQGSGLSLGPAVRRLHWKTSPIDSGRSGATSDLFHQPPPSDWNKATVSAKRAALAWARLSRAC